MYWSVVERFSTTFERHANVLFFFPELWFDIDVTGPTVQLRCDVLEDKRRK